MVSETGKHQPFILRRVTALVWVVLVGIVISFAFFASSLCITFLLAGFLAILVDPIPTFLERCCVPRLFSSAVLVVSGVLGLGLLVYASYGRASTLIEDAPEYADRIRDAIRPLTKNIEKVQKSAGSLNPVPAPPKKVPEVRVREPVSWPSYLIRGVSSVWGTIIVGAVVPFLMFFMLVRKSHLYAWLSTTFGATTDVPKFTDRLCRMVRGFVVGNIVIGAAMAAIMVAVLISINLHGAVLLGIVSGFLNLVPFLGVILASLVALLPALLQFESPGPFLIIFGMVVVLHFISADLLVPKFVGSRVNIGPVAAIVGILFWGWLWGVMGVLLAIPLTAFIKLVADSHPSLLHISNLLAETPRPIPKWAQLAPVTIAKAIPYLHKRHHADVKH